MNHVLIVEDDIDSANSLRELIGGHGFSVAVAHSLRDARRQLAMHPPGLVLLDLRLPDGNGMDLLSAANEIDPAKVVLVTGHASLDSSIEALRQGVMDYLVKPVRLERLHAILSRFSKHVQDAPRANGKAAPAGSPMEGQFGRLWGQSPPMQRIYKQIGRVARTTVTVLITGESGTGKEVVAQTLHEMSTRSAKPFLAVNCGAISPNLIESEIFGHEKGSFTGADRQHLGFFERAAGGTLFLDEVTEMPPELQVKLLRVLETGRFMRVGSTQSVETDVRIIAATNRFPHEAVAEGKLREDLLYRLNVFPIELPPLRERLSDVPLLAEHFLRQISEQEGLPKHFTPAALEALSSHSWPGNIRELRNVVQRAYVMTSGEHVDIDWLPRPERDLQRPIGEAAVEPALVAAPAVQAAEVPELRLPIGLSMAQAEKLLIQATLKRCQNQKERTAAVLGISLKTLYNRLKHYGCTKPHGDAPHPPVP